MPQSHNLSKATAEWLDRFCTENRRPPRLLHIGNIANNAYLAAKFLNQAGLDCDVLCYDYYHIMGCPEWEDADYVGDIRNDFYPTWKEVDLRGFERPQWFVQGPLAMCLDYLLAKREGRTADAESLWTALAAERELTCAKLRGEVPPPSRLAALTKLAGKAIRKFWKLPYILAQRIPKLHWFIMSLGSSPFMTSARRVCREYKAVFPSRSDELQPIELRTYAMTFPRWARLLPHYDLVVGYATDGVFPMLAGVPYAAFEHGTIRNLPFEATSQGRICALTYRLANAVFITNCDNKVAADRLGLTRYRFVPHPINEAEHATVDPAAIRLDVRKKLDSDFVVFHPSRQHWSAKRDTSWDKGNDILIEGFARFVKEVNPRAGAIFVEWGQTLPQTKELLTRLGVMGRVMWIPAQPTPRMNGYVQACDAAGRPVLHRRLWQHDAPRTDGRHAQPHLLERGGPPLVPAGNAAGAQYAHTG